MKIKSLTFLAICFFVINGCAKASREAVNQTTDNSQAAGGKSSGSSNNENASFKENSNAPNPETVETQTAQPKTVRDFFMVLPEKYFTLEGCDRAKDKDCRQARIDYLKTLGEVEDIANGYIKGGCDGGQACMEMALFKRPDATYMVGLGTSTEMMEVNYFLDYKNGIWTDISSKIVPEFSEKNQYELPRYGTTVKVFAKKVIEKGDDYEATEKGEKLYDLEWKNGSFTKK